VSQQHWAGEITFNAKSITTVTKHMHKYFIHIFFKCYTRENIFTPPMIIPNSTILLIGLKFCYWK
jgi:hypothetical protein